MPRPTTNPRISSGALRASSSKKNGTSHSTESRAPPARHTHGEHREEIGEAVLRHACADDHQKVAWAATNGLQHRDFGLLGDAGGFGLHGVLVRLGLVDAATQAYIDGRDTVYPATVGSQR